jgi:ADP-ribose pyrophosphatase YjhB (NUDIX family)
MTTSLLLALLLALLQTPRDRPATAPAAGGVVSGRVYAEATGAPIQGALVMLSPSSAPMDGWSAVSFGGSGFRIDTAGYSVETDVAGAFVIPGIRPGEYRLVARPGYFGGRYLAAGYQAVRAGDSGKPIAVRNGDRLAGLDIALPTAAAIEGRVIDDSGASLSMMTVVAARIMPGSDVPQPVRHRPTLTDDLGRYRIYGLEPGEYIVAADGLHFVTGTVARGAPLAFATTFHPSVATDSAAQRIRLTAGRDASGIDILVARSSLVDVSGTVLDSRGVPASTVNGLLTRSTLPGEGTHPFHTDADGRFRVHGLDAGNYRLLIGRGGPVNGRVEYADLPLSIVGNIEGLVVPTQPGIAVSGRVILAEGQALEMRALRITFERSGVAVRTLETIATIDDDRRFRGQDLFGAHLVRVAGLPAGSTVKAVMLRGEDITDVPTVFRTEDSDQLQVVITSRASTLDGVVRDEGTSAPVEAIVYVFGEDRGAWRTSSPRTHKSDGGADGKFSVSGLAAGRYYAIAIARDGFRQVPNAGEAFFDLLSKEATPFVIGDDERRTLELRPWRWPE